LRKKFIVLIITLLISALIPAPFYRCESAIVDSKRPEPARIALFLQEDKRGQSIAPVASYFIENIRIPQFDRKITVFSRELPIYAKEDFLTDIIKDLKKKKISLGVSLVREPLLSKLCEVCHKESFPLLSGWSEKKDLKYQDGSLSPFLFTIDFPETFRPYAIAEWASKRTRKNWTVFLDNMDDSAIKLGNMSSELLQNIGKESRILFVPRNRISTLSGMLEKSKSLGTDFILSWLPPSDTVRLYRKADLLNMKGTLLIYGYERDDTLLNTDGVLLFSQDPFLDERSFQQIISDLPENIREETPYSPNIVRAKLLSEWTGKMLSTAGEAELTSKTVIQGLEKIETLEIPGYRIEIDSKDHRPGKKNIYLIESSNGIWQKREQYLLEISGPEGFSIAR
jgi:hypothetical protein